MDGPIRIGQRMLSIEFEKDRHAQQRIELAYRRVETQQAAKPTSETTVQNTESVTLTTDQLATEIQG